MQTLPSEENVNLIILVTIHKTKEDICLIWYIWLDNQSLADHSKRFCKNFGGDQPSVSINSEMDSRNTSKFVVD